MNITGRKQKEDTVSHYMGVGLALGLSLGTALGLTWGNFGTGSIVGLCVGLVIGGVIGEHKRKKSDGFAVAENNVESEGIKVPAERSLLKHFHGGPWAVAVGIVLGFAIILVVMNVL